MAHRPLLRNRDFMLLWSGGTLSELGSQTSTVAYPLLILALTGSPAKAGVVGLAKWLPVAVFALPAGVLADRVDRKLLMIACDAIRAMALASIPVALWLGRPAYVQIVVVAFLDGALFITSRIAERGALRQVVPTEQLPDAVARTQAREFAGIVAGPPLGGLLFAAARALPFIVDTISFLASMIGLSLMRSRFQGSRVAKEPRRRSGVAEMAEGVAWLWRRPFFRGASLLFAAGNPIFTGLYLLAILLAKRHGASSAEVGAMFAIVGAGGLLGAVVASPLRRRVSARTALVGQSWVLVAAIPLLLATHAAALIGLVVAACELFTPLSNSIVAGDRVAAAPDHLQGRVAATAAMIAMSLGWLGPLAAGIAFQRDGPTATVLLIAGWALALAVTATLAPPLRMSPTVASEPAR